MSERVKLNIKPVFINPTVDRLSDTRYVFVLQTSEGDIDLSGYTAKMQLRPYIGAKKVYDELTTENGRLEIVGNRIIMRFPAAVTAEYKFDRAVYDLYIVSEEQYRVAEGEVEIKQEVTR